VKIYAGRVDSVHTETFKMLGGLARGAGPQAEEDGAEGDEGEEGAEGEAGEGPKEPARRRRDAATLEPPEAHTAAALEAAVAVDPLFHKTSAQFDEGGARGLLMHALFVHRGCDVVFDSETAPDFGPGEAAAEARLDLRPLAGALAAARAAVAAAAEQPLRLTPALEPLRAQLPGAVESSAGAAAAAAAAAAVAAAPPAAEAWAAGGVFAAAPPGEEGAAAAAFEEDMFSGMDGGEGGWEEGEEAAPPAAPAGRFRLGAGGALEWLSAAGGAAVARRAWAGASHWRFAAPAAPAEAAPRRKPAARKAPFAIDFLQPPPAPDAAAFERPRRAADTQLAGAAATADTLLPADLRYAPQTLARFFLKPAFSRGRGAAAPPAAAEEEAEWGGGGWEDGGGDDGGGWGAEAAEEAAAEAGEAAAPLAAPRLVAKISVNYARSAKVVDVRALKAALWEGLQALAARAKDRAVSFAELLERLPAGCGAASLADISVHMCVICVLHLANENDLVLTGVESLQEMRIKLP